MSDIEFGRPLGARNYMWYSTLGGSELARSSGGKVGAHRVSG